MAQDGIGHVDLRSRGCAKLALTVLVDSLGTARPLQAQPATIFLGADRNPIIVIVHSQAWDEGALEVSEAPAWEASGVAVLVQEAPLSRNS